MIVKTLPIVRLQLNRRAGRRDCGHQLQGSAGGGDAERADPGCEAAANKCESETYASCQPRNKRMK